MIINVGQIKDVSYIKIFNDTYMTYVYNISIYYTYIEIYV